LNMPSSQHSSSTRQQGECHRKNKREARISQLSLR
jgi:hypothetical protein